MRKPWFSIVASRGELSVIGQRKTLVLILDVLSSQDRRRECKESRKG